MSNMGFTMQELESRLVDKSIEIMDEHLLFGEPNSGFYLVPASKENRAMQLRIYQLRQEVEQRQIRGTFGPYAKPNGMNRL